MPTGKVRFYDADKGFGFIAEDDGRDVFLHANALPEGVTTLKKGARVEFGVVEGRKGAQALQVKVLEPTQSVAANITKPARQIEPVLPGISSKWNGRATVDYWPAYPWTKGSYSYWKVGQYTKFSGAEREIEGACHFCGEHTSIDFQGYLNGAVETGQRAASEIVAALR